jgi:CRISPR/Cas system-associated exonuclease Cas4 (RecB family)
MVMRIDRWKYLKLLKSYNMNIFPKAIGFPKQRYISHYDQLWEFFYCTRGNDICFMSSNSYPKIENINGRRIPTAISVNNLFSDFDDKNKPENAMRDMRKLTVFLIKEKIPLLNAYSGMKGFADYIKLKPKVYKYNVKDKTGHSVKKLIYGINQYFNKQLKLTTMDKKVMKDPKRLCRMLFSPHCDSDGNLNGRYCFPLMVDQALNWSINDIVEYSYEPMFHIPCTLDNNNIMTLTEMADYFNIDFDEIDSSVEFVEKSKENIESISDTETKLLLAGLEKVKPCIVNGLKDINPDHDVRFAFACYMKRLGIDINSAIIHYENIGKHFKYVDLHREDKRREQFENIYDPINDYNYEPSCSKIRYELHFCLGEKCPRFHKEWRK